MKRLPKAFMAYESHLKKTFRDGFPNGSNYQRREVTGLDVAFLRGPEMTEVFMTVPEWTRRGRETRTFLHSLIATRLPGFEWGTILKPSTKRPKGTLKAFEGIAWNRV